MAFLIVAELLLMSLSTGLCHPLAIQSGLVEGLPSPLGVATLRPRFSWTFESSGRNLTQQSYRLVLALERSDVLSLAAGSSAGVCDSGWVLSSHSTLVECAASDLIAGEVYWWSVQATASNGFVTSWMEPQRFSIGLQARADWASGAKFIGLASADGNDCPWFRTLFNVSAEDIAIVQSGKASALLHVASIGFHEAYVNGDRLEAASVLIPSVSDLGKRVLGHTYDTGHVLVAGVNIVAFWAAPGWSSLRWPQGNYNISKAPLVMSELRIKKAGGTTPMLSVVTNSSWRARPSNTRHSGAWQWSNYGGEVLNHSLDFPGWSTSAVTTASWDRASEYNVNRLITPESLEAVGVVEHVPAVSVSPCTNQPQCFVVTMAKLFTGWLEVTAFSGIANTTVTLQYSGSAGVAQEWEAQDTVVLGSGVHGTSFSNRFNWHEFQYVTVSGVQSAPNVSAFSGRRLMNRMPRRGWFESSDSMLNQVYGGFVSTHEGLTISGQLVDCPNRERLGYGGDAHSHIEFAMYTYDSEPFFNKWLQDWSDVSGQATQDQPQAGPGNLPNTAPTFDGAGGPAWGGISVVLPYELYLVSGDLRMLATAYPTMKTFLHFLLHHSGNGTQLLKPDGFDFLGDWQSPHGCGAGDDIVLFNNAYFVYILRLAAVIAKTIGASPLEAAAYSTAADAVGAAVHEKFFNSSAGRYAAGGNSFQGYQVMALIAELVPAELTSRVLAALVDEITNVKAGHLDTGMHTTYFMAKLLSSKSVRRNDLLLEMAINPTWPSYAWFIKQNLTTWPETWHVDAIAGAVSKMHGTLNGFGLWFPQGLLGVRADPTTPGFRHFTLRPAYDVKLAWARGAVSSPFGLIDVSWAKLDGAGLALNVSIPVNSRATVWILADGPDHVQESGGPATGVAEFLRQEGDETIWALGSGAYNFRTTAAAIVI